MDKLISLITLKAWEGSRSQITLVIMGVLNILISLGIVHLTQEQLTQANTALQWVLAYFFVEKVNRISGAPK